MCKTDVVNSHGAKAAVGVSPIRIETGNAFNVQAVLPQDSINNNVRRPKEAPKPLRGLSKTPDRCHPQSSSSPIDFALEID